MFQRFVKSDSIQVSIKFYPVFCRITKFQQQPDLWKEIEKVTEALRAESDTNDPEKQFLCDMFRHISSG